MCNRHLSIDNQIDHRSYERQGKLKIPTIHEGADARKIEENISPDECRTVHGNQMIKTKCTTAKGNHNLAQKLVE